MYYGMKIGLSYQEALDMPLGSLLDYIAIDKIACGGVKLKKTEEQEENEFFAMLAWR